MQNEYRHRPIHGLPLSLLLPDGNTVVAISLMQRKAGLNRNSKRDLQASPKNGSGLAFEMPSHISKTDRNVLAHYMNPWDRWGSFWGVMGDTRRARSASVSRSFLTAIDIPLLNSYAPDWQENRFDRSVLLDSCSEWPRIEESLQRFWGDKQKDPIPLGVFMLWPKLILDLRKWANLSDEQKIQLGHAIFSLSSIGWTSWFVDEAISLCPELKGELGHLRNVPASVKADQSPDRLNAQESKQNGPALPPESKWIALGEEIRSIIDDWGAEPSRELLARVASAGVDASDLLDQLPEQAISPHVICAERLTSLHEHLSQLASNADLSWLNSQDLNGIMARWSLAARNATDDDVTKLADDVVNAIERVALALREFRSSQASVDEAKRDAAVLDEEAGKQTSLAQRIEMAKRQQEARQRVLAAERKHTDAMLLILAAASPMGEQFDPTIDYAALDLGSAASAESEAGFTEIGVTRLQSDAEMVEVRISEKPPVETAMEAAGIDVSDVESGGEIHRTATSSDHAAEIGAVSESEASDAPMDDSSTLPEHSDAESSVLRDTDFTAYAGGRCKPIWNLLENGRPSLAYQFANALKTQSPLLRVPPPELLRSVALAPGLIASDGPLAVAVGQAFSEIDRNWFEPGDSPSNWHTALNLLLIAATLRPMVLAPAMGGAAIASYRHLDGRYSALLELVRSVGEVSEPLTGFAMGPAVLRSAADEASQKAQLATLVKNADEWLVERAPSKKIRYAPASKVWQHWLKPSEAIYNLISPVAAGAIDQRNAVRSAADELADYNTFLALVRDTDRRQLDRRGQDIEAGALEHLWVATCEAVALAREWLSAQSVLTDAGGRLRTLVRQLQSAFNSFADKALIELSERCADDEWGQVSSASRILHDEIEAIANMFRQSDAVPATESTSKELLARDLLLIPNVSIAEDWVVESSSAQLLEALESWIESPGGTREAFTALVDSGNIAGAMLLQEDLAAEPDGSSFTQLIDKSRDSWFRDLERHIQDARRASEVGLAYGYLSDAERAACEGELSAVEQTHRETDRFDHALSRVNAVISRIEEQKRRRIQQARSELEREKGSLDGDVFEQVESPLARSDIHTFNELMQRVRLGMDPWPERELRRDAFRDYYPSVHLDVLAQLTKLEPAEVDKLIRLGGQIGQVSFELEGDTQARNDAEEVYRAWASSVGRKAMHRDHVRKVLEAMGLQIRALEQDKVGSGWSLQANPITDREICPVPHFGSRAQGRYRVVVLTDRLTPEDLLQRIGSTSQQTATIVFVLSRSPSRFWPELARLSKERQRSFLLLDESMLLVLLSRRGSRLGTWFDIALPLTYSEPYDASAGFVPAEMFYGRTSELEAVKAQGGVYFIYGGRQLGKTALLRRAERTFQNPIAEHFAVWIDLLAQGIGERRPAADVWLSISEKLRELKIPRLELPSVNPARPSTIDAFLATIKGFLTEKPGRRILLLLDEADHFFEQDARHGGAYAETRRLKQLMDETDRRFKVVFAGLHNVLRTASTSNQPLGHLNEAVRIGPLMDEHEIRAAEELITRPVEAAGFEFEDRSLVMRILAQTNYYPSLIQLYCTQLLRHLRETKLRRRDLVGPRFNIQESDIESVFSGRPLRDAIRSKFRLTLQLDDRYEVIAYAIGLEALAMGYDHAQGLDWRVIRQDCATSWWPEGFATTSEREFLALLEEMVQLGVLSRVKASERFSLRNPNVLLLLGSRQEIESTLQSEREPKIEFESTIFRPTLGGRVDNPARNPLTYRQLDEVVQMRSSVSLIAATVASGSMNLLRGLRDQPGLSDSLVIVEIEGANDKRSFVHELDKGSRKRVPNGITVMLVSSTLPWDGEWVAAAKAKVRALKSNSSFVSVVFVADPSRLWSLSADLNHEDEWPDPWLSVLPWARGFVRKWLEELQLPTDVVDLLEDLTGLWGGLLEAAAHVKGTLEFSANIDRMARSSSNAEWLNENLAHLTGGIREAETVLRALDGLGNGISEADLVEFAELPSGVVRRTLRWAEPLGLVARQAGEAWALDPFTKKMLRGGV